MKKIGKPRIGIFDLTDCEGCELEFINLREKIFDLIKGVEIVSWRLAQTRDDEPFDVAFIEGTPITPQEQYLLTQIRENSKFLIGLGACACTGGIPAMVDDDDDRPRFYKSIYPHDYKPRGTMAKPLSYYVKVDYELNGCPIDLGELERILCELLAGKIPEQRDNPVCLECKIKDNDCLMAKDKPCLGPITTGGCGAFCITHGKNCVGCYGLVKDANFERIITRLNEFQSEDETKNLLKMFLAETDDYKRFYK